MKKTLVIILLMGLFNMGFGQTTEGKADKFLQELKNAGYHKFVKHKKEITAYEKIIKDGLMKDGWLRFPDQYRVQEIITGKTIPYKGFASFNYRSIEIDGESLFEDGLRDYLENAKQLFEVRGLALDFGNENVIWGEKNDSKRDQYFKHEIVVNGENIIVADGILNQMNGYTYCLKYLEIISNQLSKQGSKEKIVLLSTQDSAVMLLVDANMEQIFSKLPDGCHNQIIKR